MSTVYVCPERDIECGRRAANWCATCPKRATSPDMRIPASGRSTEGEISLPELPEPDGVLGHKAGDGKKKAWVEDYCPVWTRYNVESFARAAVEVDRKCRAATKAAAPDAPVVRPLEDPKMAEYLKGQPWISAYIETLESELRKAKASAPADKHAILQELADQAQELNMGYGAPADANLWQWMRDQWAELRVWRVVDKSGDREDILWKVLADRIVEKLKASRAPAEDAREQLLAGLLREARATLEMWRDVAPAVSLCADIDKALSGRAAGSDTGIPNAGEPGVLQQIYDGIKRMEHAHLMAGVERMQATGKMEGWGTVEYGKPRADVALAAVPNWRSPLQVAAICAERMTGSFWRDPVSYVDPAKCKVIPSYEVARPAAEKEGGE